MGLQGKPLSSFEELEIELVFPAYLCISPLARCCCFGRSGALYRHYVLCVMGPDGTTEQDASKEVKERRPFCNILRYINGAKYFALFGLVWPCLFVHTQHYTWRDAEQSFPLL